MFNKRLLQLVHEGTRHVVWCVIFKLLALGCQALFLIQLARILGAVSEGGPSGASAAVGRALPPALVGLIASLAFQSLANRSGAKAGSAATATIMKTVFDKLVELGPTYTEHMAASEATQLMGEGTERLRPYFQNYLPQFFFSVLAPLALLSLLVPVCWQAALAMLVVVPLMPGSIMMLMKRAKVFMGEYWGTYVDLGGSFLDAIRGLTTLKTYRADDRWHERLNDEAEGFRQVTMRLLRVQMGNVFLMDFFTFGGMALGMGIALARHAMGGLDATGTFTVMLLASSFFMPMRAFGSLFHTGMNANAVIERILALLDVPHPQGGASIAAHERPGIEVQNLSYAYPHHAEALHDLSLTVAPNTLVCVTGESGAGKSTLVRVLSGATSDYKGSVKICGVELRELSRESLRNTVTVVGNAAHVFKGSIRSNLLLAKEDATDTELWSVLHAAQLSEFVLSMGGLDAEVSEDGRNLSGGQRQRLCFARALLRDTPIYLFDEATSNIDAASENKLLEGIEQLSIQKTVLVVTHRLKPFAWSDDIYVLDQGRVAERGSYYDLIRRKDGIYRRLWDQLSDLESYAEQGGVEYDTEVYKPTDAEVRAAEALASSPNMPVMGAHVMAAALEAMSYERFFQSSAPDQPLGHPAWIPLPNYHPKEEAAPKAVASEEEGCVAREAHDNPKRRSVPAIVGGLLALTHDMVGEVALAGLLGALGNLCVIGQAACAAWGVLRTQTLLPVLAGMVVLGLLRGALHYGERLETHDQTFRTLACVRDRVFGHLRRLAPARLEERDAGDLVSLVTTDVELLEGVYSRSLGPIVSALASSLTVAILLFSAAPLLGVMALVGYVVVGAVLPTLARRLTRERAEDIRSYAVLMTSFLLDSLRGMAELVQCGRARVYADEMSEHIDSLGSGERSLASAEAALAALPRTVAYLSAGLVCLLTVHEVSSGSLDLSVGVACAAGYLASLDAVVDVARLGFSLSQTLAAADRILDVLDELPVTPDVDAGLMPSRFRGAALCDVTFGYGDHQVLDGLSLRIPAGKVLRVTGPSGSGKSTILKLLMRYWDPERGHVEISGQDARAIDTKSLRALEAYMVQDTYLFAATLRDNLLIARPDAGDEELWAVLDDCNLRRVCERLPQGLDTLMGVGGWQLSDGERQRIGLARALLSDAPFMLLDEPTSNLDSLSEAQVLQVIARERGSRTVLVVSHRKTVAAIADDTYVHEPLHAG